MPSPHDFTVLEAVSSVLQPLQLFTDALSRENVTISAIRPLLKHITDKLLVVLDDDCNLVREIKDSVREDLLARYTDEEITTLIDKPAILDPRFKACHISSKEETTARLPMKLLILLRLSDLSQQDLLIQFE